MLSPLNLNPILNFGFGFLIDIVHTLVSVIVDHLRLVFFSNFFPLYKTFLDCTFIKGQISKNIVLKIGFNTNPCTFISVLSALYVYEIFEMFHPVRLFPIGLQLETLE